LWLHSLKVAKLLRSAACLHTNQSRSYLNLHVITIQISKRISTDFNDVLAVSTIHEDDKRASKMFAVEELRTKTTHKDLVQRSGEKKT